MLSHFRETQWRNRPPGTYVCILRLASEMLKLSIAQRSLIVVSFLKLYLFILRPLCCSLSDSASPTRSFILVIRFVCKSRQMVFTTKQPQLHGIHETTDRQENCAKAEQIPFLVTVLLHQHTQNAVLFTSNSLKDQRSSICCEFHFWRGCKWFGVKRLGAFVKSRVQRR